MSPSPSSSSSLKEVPISLHSSSSREQRKQKHHHININISHPLSPPCQSTPFRCLICLEDQPPQARAAVLPCNHPVCTRCLADQFTHAIMVQSVAFPRCVYPGCRVYASDSAVQHVLETTDATNDIDGTDGSNGSNGTNGSNGEERHPSSHVLARMRQLRALKPARSADGRRMYCVAPNCYEPLPPPLPVADRPGDDDNHTNGNDNNNNNGNNNEMSNISTCPKCQTDACMRCGSRSHGDTKCTVPIVCRRQRRLYEMFAVGRIAACTRCGIHILRDGGCSTVTCSRCRYSFQFQPFRTPEEVAAANQVQDLMDISAVQPISWANAFGVLVSASFSMLLGAIVSGVFCAYLLDAFSKWSFDWFLLFIIPQFLMGVVFFVLGFFGVLAICRDLLTQIGVNTPHSLVNVVGIAILSGSMLTAQFYVRDFLASSGYTVELWQWVLCFFPVIICNLTLLVMAVAHLAVISVRAIVTLRGRRGFESLRNSNNGNNEPSDTTTLMGENRNNNVVIPIGNGVV